MSAMPSARGSRTPLRWLGFLLLVAIAVVFVQSAIIPHTHAGVGPGLYNEDHDLALLATLHGAAVLLDAQPAPFVFAAVPVLLPPGGPAPASTPRSTADSRAPPVR
jgi:hypothetical protein